MALLSNTRPLQTGALLADGAPLVVAPEQLMLGLIVTLSLELALDSTFSVGWSALDKEKARVFVVSKEIEDVSAVPEIVLNVIVATFVIVRTAFDVSLPTLTEILAAPFERLASLTIVENSELGVMPVIASTETSYVRYISTIETTFCPGSTITSAVRLAQAAGTVWLVVGK